jgi:hypothetical protein
MLLLYDPNLDAEAPSAKDASICPDDLFHASARRLEDPAIESPKIYVASANVSVGVTHTASSPMTDFLMHVAQARKVTGSNVESWVTAVESKLADIGILTISSVVSSIPSINSRLFQVGHVPMFICTLAIMGRKGVARISLPNESSSAAYNAHEMTSFLRSVAGAKGITGADIETWIGQVHRKLHKIGATSVRGTVSILILLNRKLRSANLQMMHSQTIDIMAWEGVDALRQEAQELSDYEDEGAGNEAGDGWCTTCRAPGKVGQACTTFDDGISVYLNFHTGY